MKIAVIGGTGRAGSEIVKELAGRGHAVTAIARHVDTVLTVPGVTFVPVDAADVPGLTAALEGHDAVVSSIQFSSPATPTLVDAVRAAGVGRYLVVGGAAGLKNADGIRLFDAPGFPEAWKPEAGAGIDFLGKLKTVNDIDWTFLSPSMMFIEGPRTGKFRLGDDDLLSAPDGSSSISFADYAIAVADEIEAPAHSRRRFTVGY
ncbi:MAG: NAD(P)-dependent oxidoreductase [Janthinobacterium lividum]